MLLICQAYAASQTGANAESAMQLPSVVPTESFSSLKLAPQPPSFEDMSSGEDSDVEEDERPLTRQELEKKTMKELTKRNFN